MPSASFASPIDINDVLGIKNADEANGTATESSPVGDLEIDLDSNFPSPIKPPTPTNVPDSSINARLTTLEQNQGVIINKLNTIAQAVAKPQLTRNDVDVVVRKAINDLVVPHLTVRTKEGINKTVPTSNGAFRLNPGERIIAIDGVPVGPIKTVPKSNVIPTINTPVYQASSGDWDVRYTTSRNGSIFGNVRSNCPGNVCPTR